MAILGAEIAVETESGKNQGQDKQQEYAVSDVGKEKGDTGS